MNKQHDIPDLHDWEIINLSTDRLNKAVNLKLWLPNADQYALLSFSGVSHFVSSGMRLQNVILDFLVFEEFSESDDFQYCSKKLNFDKSRFNKIGDDMVVLLEPSVGLEICCCCEGLDFEILGCV